MGRKTRILLLTTCPAVIKGSMVPEVTVGLFLFSSTFSCILWSWKVTWNAELLMRGLSLKVCVRSGCLNAFIKWLYEFSIVKVKSGLMLLYSVHELNRKRTDSSDAFERWLRNRCCFFVFRLRLPTAARIPWTELGAHWLQAVCTILFFFFCFFCRPVQLGDWGVQHKRVSLSVLNPPSG